MATTGGSTRAYLQANPDVLNYWLNNQTDMSLADFAQFHYDNYGENEGRQGQGLISRRMAQQSYFDNNGYYSLASGGDGGSVSGG